MQWFSGSAGSISRVVFLSPRGDSVQHGLKRGLVSHNAVNHRFIIHNHTFNDPANALGAVTTFS